MVIFDNRIIGQRADATGLVGMLEVILINLAQCRCIIFKRAYFAQIARAPIMQFGGCNRIIDTLVKFGASIKTRHAHFAVIGHCQPIIINQNIENIERIGARNIEADFLRRGIDRR